MILGFDPGGAGMFGWAVAETGSGNSARLIASGRASNAEVAVDLALRCVAAGEVPTAAGIDAPLYWTATGERRADAYVRRQIHRRGAPHPAGTVQHPNSLRGACLLQGVVAATLLRRRYPMLPITETHPK